MIFQEHLKIIPEFHPPNTKNYGGFFFLSFNYVIIELSYFQPHIFPEFGIL